MLLDARPLRNAKLEEYKKRVERLNIRPHLVIIRVGNDPASEKYVNNKEKMCKEVGVESTIIHLDERVTNEDVKNVINVLNSDESVTGILLQLPLPKHLDEDYLTNLIVSSKDVDGFTIENTGRLSLGLDAPVACTPKGIITLLKYYKIDMAGKDVLIINRSNIVGKPLAHLFLKENATVTIAHSKTKDLFDKIKNYDIIVTAIGKPGSFYYGDFREGQTIIDVSINVGEDGKLCGDVYKPDYIDIITNKKCNITPVPNGVGVMTVLSLIEQVIEMREKEEDSLV